MTQTSSPARTGSSREKTAWWITFSALTLAIVLMLALWN